MRVTNAPTHRRKVNKLKRLTKGMSKSRQTNLKMGRQAVVRSLEYAYRDRRNRKRDFRSLWITRINNAARVNGTTYRELIAGLKKAKINLNRKMLAELAVNEPAVFAEIVKKAK
jgi:large subunit ribosomal protein L20